MDRSLLACYVSAVAVVYVYATVILTYHQASRTIVCRPRCIKKSVFSFCEQTQINYINFSTSIELNMNMKINRFCIPNHVSEEILSNSLQDISLVVTRRPPGRSPNSTRERGTGKMAFHFTFL